MKPRRRMAKSCCDSSFTMAKLAISVLLMTAFASQAFADDNEDSSSMSLERSKRWASAAPPPGIAKLNALDVICGKDHMTIRAEFNGPFQGIVFSKGTYGQDSCVYVKPHSSVTHTTFKVYYDQCGTKPDLQGKYYENTIVIQYGTDIIEAWDEAKRLRCEWFEAYEKPATFRPAIPVADLDVVEMNFQGDDIDCWMEIQEGKGPWSREVSRIVPVGQPMTIVVSINDYNGHFDMRVKSCFAHDGVKPPIHLTDEYGCVLRPKMLTAFNKVRDSNGKATMLSYSHFYAFKFPDTMNVQIQCTVEVCRHGCPDACQKGPYPAPVREIHSKVTLGASGQANNLPEPRQPSSHAGEEEPQPVYQEVGSRPSATVRLPGIHDPEVSAHATRFLEAQGVDLHKLRAASSLDKGAEETRDSFVSLPAAHFDAAAFAAAHRPDNIGAEIELIEDESKPVIKVVDIEIPADKRKPPTISEQPALFPQDLDQASKLLSNLGLNMDLGTFAQGFIKNMQNKEIQGLLQNDQLRQLAAASGVKLPSQLPRAQALVNGSETVVDIVVDDSLTTTIRPLPIYEAEPPSTPTAPLKAPPPPQPQQHHHQQPQQQQQHHHQQHQQQQQHRPQQQQHLNQQQLPHGIHPQHVQFQNLHLPPGVRPPPQHLSQEVLAKLHAQQQAQAAAGFGGHFHNQAGVAQVLNIPMNPNLQALPPSFTNFVAQPPGGFQAQAPVKNRPLFFGGFNLPTLRLPSIFGGSGGHPNAADSRKDSPAPRDGQAGGSTSLPGGAHPTPRPGVFPQGPRSMRLRRSAGSEISVNRQFQVVTAIDLAFFPNATTDLPQAIEGRREEVVYGVCLPLMGLAASLSCVLCIITCALAFSVAAVFRMNKLKASRKAVNAAGGN